MWADTRNMARTAFPAAIIAALALLPVPAPAQDGCRLCYSSPGAVPGERPLSIDIFADLSLGKLAMTGRGGGSVTVDPESSGKRTQGEMMDLGGTTISGRGLIRGEPLRDVRVDLPDRVPMSAPDGSEAELTGFTTNLPRPPGAGQQRTAGIHLRREAERARIAGRKLSRAHPDFGRLQLTTGAAPPQRLSLAAWLLVPCLF